MKITFEVTPEELVEFADLANKSNEEDHQFDEILRQAILANFNKNDRR